MTIFRSDIYQSPATAGLSSIKELNHVRTVNYPILNGWDCKGWVDHSLPQGTGVHR